MPPRIPMPQEQARNSAASKATVVTLAVSSGVPFYLLLPVLKT